MSLTLIVKPGAPIGDPVAEFAAKHIGDADTVDVEVVYEGHEGAPDILTVDRSGAVVAARSADA
jgi:hypothetical protein